MIRQDDFDTLADGLVAEGKLVSYSTIQKALRDRPREPGKKAGKGMSDRDLKDPFSTWRDKRRYKGHLAVLKLPEEMEKAIALFVALTMKDAENRVKSEPSPEPAAVEQTALMVQMERLVGRLEEQLATLAAENRILREIIGTSRPAGEPAVEPTVRRAPGPKVGGRRKGVSASTSRFFWDRLVQELTSKIRRDGPQTLADLYASIDDETRAMAKTAFEAIDIGRLEEKLAYRVDSPRHPLTKLKDGTYSLKKGPLRPRASTRTKEA